MRSIRLIKCRNLTVKSDLVRLSVIVEIRRLRGGFQSYSDLASELPVSRDAA